MATNFSLNHNNFSGFNNNNSGSGGVNMGNFMNAATTFNPELGKKMFKKFSNQQSSGKDEP